MRTPIYARYSSQLQNSRSIEDQIRVCTERADLEGWTVVDVYSGGAPGTSERQRPGMNALLARVEAGGIDQVLADTTSRIARNQGDAHHIRDRLDYCGARLFTLGDGEIDAFKGAIKGFWTSNSGRSSPTTSSGLTRAGLQRDGRRLPSRTGIEWPTGSMSGGALSAACGRSTKTRRNRQANLPGICRWPISPGDFRALE